MSHVLEFSSTRSAFDSDYFFGDLVLEDPGRVAQGAEDVDGVLFGGRNNRVFNVLVDGAVHVPEG